MYFKCSLVCCQPAGQRRESFEVKRQQLNTMGGYYGGALGNMAPSPAGPGGLLQAGQSMTPPPSLSGSSSNLSISEPRPLIFLLVCFCLILLFDHLWPFQVKHWPAQGCKIRLLRNSFIKGIQFLCFVVVFVHLARRSKTVFNTCSSHTCSAKALLIGFLLWLMSEVWCVMSEWDVVCDVSERCGLWCRCEMWFVMLVWDMVCDVGMKCYLWCQSVM